MASVEYKFWTLLLLYSFPDNIQIVVL